MLTYVWENARDLASGKSIWKSVCVCGNHAVIGVTGLNCSTLMHCMWMEKRTRTCCARLWRVMYSRIVV